MIFGTEIDLNNDQPNRVDENETSTDSYEFEGFDQSEKQSGSMCDNAFSGSYIFGTCQNVMTINIWFMCF